MNTPFPCTACGLCCRRVTQSEQTAWLDRGDGVCRHFDDASHLCLIYEQRPLVCRVGDYYQTYLSKQFTWDEFVQINVAICQQFQKENQ